MMKLTLITMALGLAACAPQKDAESTFKPFDVESANTQLVGFDFSGENEDLLLTVGVHFTSATEVELNIAKGGCQLLNLDVPYAFDKFGVAKLADTIPIDYDTSSMSDCQVEIFGYTRAGYLKASTEQEINSVAFISLFTGMKSLILDKE